MPTLDDVDIAVVQRGDVSRGVVIPGIGGLGGAFDGRRWGGDPAGGGGPAGGSGPAPALGKGMEKHVRVVLDDDEVSSDEDAPLQKWL
jgi:hypothetical protein